MARKANQLPVRQYVLATDRSPKLVRCYAAHGVGRYHCPVVGSELEVVLINAARHVRESLGRVTDTWHIQVDDAPYPSDWRLLGYRYRDGSLPKGPLDAVDPELAILEDLIVANTPIVPDHTAGQARAV